MGKDFKKLLKTRAEEGTNKLHNSCCTDWAVQFLLAIISLIPETIDQYSTV